MGGTIHITDDLRVTLSTPRFDYLVGRIRVEFRPAEQSVEQKLYKLVDEAGWNSIGANGLDGHEFNAFAQATIRAYAKAKTEKTFDEYDQRLWDDLLSKIEADTRYAEATAPSARRARRAARDR